ncbi:hypothetical protein SUGI_0982710 [Cryptomeria japonica]|nr:hypothetical protein SUGI_0982710 [Cryptomeria japonica]
MGNLPLQTGTGNLPLQTGTGNTYLFKQIPYVGLNFAVYESLKEWLLKSQPFGSNEGSELSVVTKLSCGAATRTVGQTVAYPLDVIRRRIQMVKWKDASIVMRDGRSNTPLQYLGMIDTFRKTVRNEGFGALYRGLVPNSVKSNGDQHEINPSTPFRLGVGGRGT